MARILCKERVVEYSIDFKIKVVQLTDKLDVSVMQIAAILDLHPVMIYRWRQEYREGKFIASPTRKISMTKHQTEQPRSKEERSELARLRKEVADLKKENDFLKKWDRYLKDQKSRDSAS